jgi:ubiquinone/menaquinone biosynthesis C-methylase UbiE
MIAVCLDRWGKQILSDARTFSYEEARAFYDRFGTQQDRQRFYEDPALADLIRHGDFGHAQSVLEFGCGTGRLAEILLTRYLPSTASYLGVDVSSTMVDLSRDRLHRFGDRVKIYLTEGEPKLKVKANFYDRFLATYVLDLLSIDDIHAILAEAHRVLCPKGLLVLASLTHGNTCASRLIGRAWVTVHALRPSLVGGCRPISIREFLANNRWKLCHRKQITRFGLSSEVVIAEKLLPSTDPTRTR